MSFLYDTIPGRILLRPLVSRPVSLLAGKMMDSRLSKLLIGPFAGKCGIDRSEYLPEEYNCFNDFFCRRIRPELRPVSDAENDLVAPCDGLLSAARITKGTVLRVKQSAFTIDTLLRDRKLARTYEGGYCLVYRLCVNHYHRYIYFDSGKKYKNRRIGGIYHTVRPAALAVYPVYTENTREYTVIDTKNFGRCVQMEVGALLVGRIVNEDPLPGQVRRGEEKGHFEYGGSTILVLIPPGRACLRDDIVKTTESGEELPVRMGEAVGRRIDPAT